MATPITGAGASRVWVSSLAVSCFVACWELAPRLGLLDPRLVSQPTRIVAAGIRIAGAGGLAVHLTTSLLELSLGMALALGVGVPLGLLLGASRPLREFLEAPLMALYAAPRLALLPILVVWLGIGLESKVAVVFVGAVLPIVINAAAGVRGVDRSLVVAARSLGARRIDVFRKVLLPGALPAVVAGIRMGIGRGLLGVVVGEMYASQRGIGHLILSTGAGFRVDELLFYTLLVSGFGVALTSGMRKLEERLRPWSVAR
jgi:sulfonate transport system permease protein